MSPRRRKNNADRDPPNRGKLTLRLEYWHQHPYGESEQHRKELANLLRKYIRLLHVLNHSGREYPWKCCFVPLEHGVTKQDQIVAVKVDFVHTIDTPDKTRKTPSEYQQLWAELVRLVGIDEFQNMFGNPMIRMNIYIVHAAQYLEKLYPPQGIFVQSLAVKPQHIIHVAPDVWEPLQDGVILSIGEIRRFVRRHVAVIPQPAKTAEQRLEKIVLTAEAMAEGIEKTWEHHKSNQKAYKKALEDIAEATVTAKEVFHRAFEAATSRMNKLCSSQNPPSGEDIWEALVALRGILLLCPSFNDSVNNLASLRKSNNNSDIKTVVSIATISSLVALYGLGFFFCGPAFLIGSAAYGWMTAGSATCLAAGGGGIALASGIMAWHKSISSSSEFTKAKQLGISFQHLIMKLCFYTAACWLENIWFMKLKDIPTSQREIFLRNLGIDPAYFGETEYNKAWLKSSFEQMKNYYDEMQESAKKIFSDAGIDIETRYSDATT